jgi:hypothetical protein
VFIRPAPILVIIESAADPDGTLQLLIWESRSMKSRAHSELGCDADVAWVRVADGKIGVRLTPSPMLRPVVMEFSPDAARELALKLTHAADIAAQEGD